ncbi:hypothetical protein [Microscilla marina]|uniref:Uncharacterized protein n=1 Tax=Microscilla marina ATCC 23134 TaxID=313606 RepID=A1ZRA6_MICM2|nr:hypothetical protein [Microscilla marina]EAY26996.1 hypothetical protein M23134_04676 [Microscilla marina ATCC 23134]
MNTTWKIQKKMHWFFALYVALVCQTAIAQTEVDPMSHLQFLASNKWIIKDKMQQSSKTTNTGEVVFTLALDKRIINFTRYYYLGTNDLRPGTKGTLALNPFLGKIKQFTFSDDGQTTEGVLSEVTKKGFTIEYDKFLPDGQKVKGKEVFKKKSQGVIEVKRFSWNGNQWQAVSAFLWTRNSKKVAYKPVTKTINTKKYTFETREWDVPLKVVVNKKSEGLVFKPYTSGVDVYRHSYAYELVGSFKVNKMIVSKLQLKLELFDKADKLLFTKNYNAISFLFPSYRSGDDIPIKILKYVKDQPLAAIAKAKLSVQTISKVAAPEKFEPSEKVEFTWGTSQPANAAIEIRGRQNSVSKSYRKGYRSYKFLLEIKNTGKLLFKGLTLRFEWFNDQNEVIFTKKCYVVTILSPHILPGTMRLYSSSVLLSDAKVKNPGRYRIVVDSVTL